MDSKQNEEKKKNEEKICFEYLKEIINGHIYKFENNKVDYFLKHNERHKKNVSREIMMETVDRANTISTLVRAKVEEDKKKKEQQI